MRFAPGCLCCCPHQTAGGCAALPGARYVVSTWPPFTQGGWSFLLRVFSAALADVVDVQVPVPQFLNWAGGCEWRHDHPVRDFLTVGCLTSLFNHRRGCVVRQETVLRPADGGWELLLDGTAAISDEERVPYTLRFFHAGGFDRAAANPFAYSGQSAGSGGVLLGDGNGPPEAAVVEALMHCAGGQWCLPQPRKLYVTLESNCPALNGVAIESYLTTIDFGAVGGGTSRSAVDLGYFGERRLPLTGASPTLRGEIRRLPQPDRLQVTLSVFGDHPSLVCQQPSTHSAWASAWLCNPFAFDPPQQASLTGHNCPFPSALGEELAACFAAGDRWVRFHVSE